MKKRLYMILSISIIICFLSFAAVCNPGELLNIEGSAGELSKEEELQKEIDALKKNEQNSEKDESSDDSKKEDTKKDDSKDADGDKKDEPKSEDNKSDDNKPPVITGIFLDGLDPVDYFFFIDDTYTVRAEATDPEGSSLTFKWSGDGTIASGELNPMTWTAPDSEGVYKITVEATDEKGSTASLTADIYVKIPVSIGEPPVDLGSNPPEVHDIIINTSPLYVNTKYYVRGDITDPDNDLDKFQFDVSGGSISDKSANTAYWTTPAAAGDYTISLTVWDKESNEDSLIVSFSIIEK